MNNFAGSIRLRLFALLGVFILLAAGGSWWYFSHYTKTPEYALKMVQESIEKHDKEKFSRFVDSEHLVDAASDALLDGLIEATVPTNLAGREAMSNFTKMFKAPIAIGLTAAMDNYIAYGQWERPDNAPADEKVSVDLDMILNRSGLKGLSFRKIDSVAVANDAGTAVANVRVFQAECNEEYVLNVVLQRDNEDAWKVYEISNFKDFISFYNTARQQQMAEYLNQSADIIQGHNNIAAEIDSKLANTIKAGSLGNNKTRAALKAIAIDEMAAEWQARKSDLEAMEVPEAAKTLHNLRIKICDLKLQYAENYAKWMDDKKAATLREADSAMKRSRTLEKEAEALTRQVTANVQ